MNNDDPSGPQLKPRAGEADGLPDDALRAGFAALRREEAEQAPPFAGLWGRKVHSGRRRWGWFVATACVLIAAAVFWIRLRQPEPSNTVASITEWKAPTDFLLETPGSELLRSVPRFGELDSNGWSGDTERVPPARPLLVHKKVLP